jgi:hypothetical protein
MEIIKNVTESYSITLNFGGDREEYEKLLELINPIKPIYDSLGKVVKVGDIGGFSDVSIDDAKDYLISGITETFRNVNIDGSFCDDDGLGWDYFVKAQLRSK